MVVSLPEVAKFLHFKENNGVNAVEHVSSFDLVYSPSKKGIKADKITLSTLVRVRLVQQSLPQFTLDVITQVKIFTSTPSNLTCYKHFCLQLTSASTFACEKYRRA